MIVCQRELCFEFSQSVSASAILPPAFSEEWQPLRELRDRAVSQLAICLGANTFNFADMDQGKIT